MYINKIKQKICVEKIIEYLIFLIFLTSSFDIFLTFDILGFTFRISQLLCIIFFILCFYKIIKGKNKILDKPLGIKQLLFWTIILLLFTFNTVYPVINLGYHLWLIFNIIIIICFTQIINKHNCYKYFKLYILSFAIIAIIGILQAFFSIIGFDVPFIQQWWIKGVLPRINGLCFEPSYYATYMLIGWGMCRILTLNSEISKKIGLKIVPILLLITIAIVLSSSRMGIALMVGVEGLIFVRNIYLVFRKKELKVKKQLIVQAILIIIALIVLILVLKESNFNFLLAGTGINGTSSHSVSERESNFIDVLNVFKESPVLGRGLGGIYAEMSVNEGLDITKINPQNATPGTCVFAEVLAASGIVGFMFFMWYILKIIFSSIKLSRKINNTSKYIMIALVFALVIELIILQFNQNILRQYLWLHIAMISAYYNIFKEEK